MPDRPSAVPPPLPAAAVWPGPEPGPGAGINNIAAKLVHKSLGKRFEGVDSGREQARPLSWPHRYSPDRGLDT